jgi:hypothetical protein
MTTETPCAAPNRKTATQGQGKARRRFRTRETSQFLYRILGQFSGRSVDCGNRPLLKTLVRNSFLGICLVSFWFTKRCLIGVHRKSVRSQRAIYLVTQ